MAVNRLSDRNVVDNQSTMGIIIGDNHPSAAHLRNALSPIQEASSSEQTPSTMRQLLEESKTSDEPLFKPVPHDESDFAVASGLLREGTRDSSGCFYVKSPKGCDRNSTVDLNLAMSPSVIDSNVRLDASARNMIQLESNTNGMSLLQTGHFDDDRNGPMLTQSSKTMNSGSNDTADISIQLVHDPSAGNKLRTPTGDGNQIATTSVASIGLDPHYFGAKNNINASP